MGWVMVSMCEGMVELEGWARHFLDDGVVHGHVQDTICMRRMMNVLMTSITLQMSYGHDPKCQ